MMMMMMMRSAICRPPFVLLLLVGVCVASAPPPECARSAYDRCVQMGEPLVREPHLVFPDNVADIVTVCAAWSTFIDCLKRYTERCFTDVQRRQFNAAVAHPIESVHAMCMQPSYQREYLQYAPCIKSTIVDAHRCRPHYVELVRQVAAHGESDAATGRLCCAHDRFKQCVQREARHLCADGASAFIAHTLDTSLRFLHEQCDAIVINTAAVDCAPSGDANANEFARTIPSATTSTTDGAISATTQPYTERSSLDGGVVLGSRTRPASYGRSAGSSWSSSSSVVSSSSTSAWSPSSVYDTSESSTAHATETWYPAAGNQLSNEVDEPNQQGLMYNNKNKNAVASISTSSILQCIVIIGRYFAF